MVPFQVPQNVLGVLPPALVGTNCTEPTVEPASTIIAEEHPIYLSGRGSMVFAGFLSSHLTNQRFLRYSNREDPRQESNCMLLPAVSATAFCHDSYIGRVRCGRATCFAVDDIVVFMRCHQCVHQHVIDSKRLFGAEGSLWLREQGWAAEGVYSSLGRNKVIARRYAHPL